MGHAVTARRIVSFFIVQKKARNIRLSICLLFMMYRLMSQISVWPSGKMTKHCLFLVINALHYCKKNSKLFHPVLCTWPFHPSLLPMDVLWAVSSKLRRILDISSSLLCAAFTVPLLLCESKNFQRWHRAFWIISYSPSISENTCFSPLLILVICPQTADLFIYLMLIIWRTTPFQDTYPLWTSPIVMWNEEV